MTTPEDANTVPAALRLSEGLGAGSEARCWCRACEPVTFAFQRMVVCPKCGDKRCIHAVSHEAPCAKTDLYAHNAWVERMVLRSQPAPKNSAPDEPGMVALGAWTAPNTEAEPARPAERTR